MLPSPEGEVVTNWAEEVFEDAFECYSVLFWIVLLSAS